ncbi:hypothetical protein BDW66DRAFT_76441 [Aspergillus desertorum]
MHMHRDEKATAPLRFLNPKVKPIKENMHASIQQAGESCQNSRRFLHPHLHHTVSFSGPPTCSCSSSSSFCLLPRPSPSFCGVYHICTMLALLAIYRHRRYLLACMIPIDLLPSSFHICLLISFCYYLLCPE